MSADIESPIFTDETKAREALESVRWPDGPVCPHCGGTEKIGRIQGKSHRPGLYYCGDCTGHFTVTVGTVFERSKIPLSKWWLAAHFLGSSKKGMSSHQLHRMLGVTYKTAWFMTHRIREAMRDLSPNASGPLGGVNKVVEADETYVGGKAKNRKYHVPKKDAVFSLVEREGKVRSAHVPKVNAKNLRKAIVTQVSRKSYLMTDESVIYPKIGEEFAGHGTVNHSIEEYVRGNFWHTNTVENYFSILKRGITGTYHHVSQQHLKRYLAEFDFRYNERMGLGVSDAGRAAKMMKGAEGKRLTYRQPDREATA
ncbi:MAG: IS1595 family transposase [Proteobacteria bacterium]|nr:IS1595 family transposase [Pseudomonadota bacterium]